jgi:hypothetical protein
MLGSRTTRIPSIFFFQPDIQMPSGATTNDSEKRKKQKRDAMRRFREREASDDDRDLHKDGRPGILTVAEEELILDKLKSDFSKKIYHTVQWFIAYVSLFI